MDYAGSGRQDIYKLLKKFLCLDYSPRVYSLATLAIGLIFVGNTCKNNNELEDDKLKENILREGVEIYAK